MRIRRHHQYERSRKNPSATDSAASPGHAVKAGAQRRNRLRAGAAIAVAAMTLVGSPSAFATNYYWDIDGATPGAGGATPSGTWDGFLGNTNWSTSPNGNVVTSTVLTGSADDVFFSAGTNATGAYTITVSAGPSARSLTFQEGSTTLSSVGSDVLNLYGTGSITVNNGATAVIGANTGLFLSSLTGITKIGVGTLTLDGTSQHSIIGGVRVNGGTLALNYSNLATPTNLINHPGPINTLSFGGGNLAITGKTGAGVTTTQSFGDVTVNSGGGSLLVNPNGGDATNITLGSLTATASGGSLLVGQAVGAGTGTVSITTTTDKDATGTYGGRVVFGNGTAGTGYDWATTASVASPFALSAYSGYTPLNLTAGTDTANSRVTASATLTGSRTTNSLKFENPATAQTLDVGAGNTLTLTNGGLLLTGASVAQGPRIINGTLTVGNGSGSYDLVVHSYNVTTQAVNIAVTGANMDLVTRIDSVIADNGANPVTLVKSGPGDLYLKGVNTFTGGLVINGGRIGFGTTNGFVATMPITVNTDSLLFTPTTSTAGSITLNNGAQFTIINNNSSFTVTGNVTGNGGISAANGGQGAITLNLNGTGNTFTGPIRITHNNGTQSAAINVASLADTDTLGSGNITFGAGTATSVSHNFSLAVGATAPLVLNNRRFELAGDQVNQQINNASGQSLTINSNLLVTGTRAKNLVLGGAGAGISTLAGVIANHPTPTAPGTVPIGVRTTAAVAAGGTITLASTEGIVAGATITGTNIPAGTTIATVNPLTRQITLSAATTAGIGLGTNFTIPNVVNSVSVTKNDAGSWVLTAANTYTGPTAVNAGNLNLQNANALGATSTGTLVANAGQLQLQGGISYAAEPLTLTPGTGGAAMLRNIAGSNTWTGPITANSTAATQVSRVQAEAGSSLTLSGPIALGGTQVHQFVLQGDGAINMTGQITGIGRLTSGNTGTGVRTVSNDTNNFTGSVSGNGGIIAFTSVANVGAASSALGAPTTAVDGTIAVGNTTFPSTIRYIGTAPTGHTTDRVVNLAGTTGGATIEANGVGPIVFTSAMTATGAGIKTLTLAGTSTSNNTINGAIVDNSAVNTTSLTKSDTGTWILGGVSTYTGATTVSAGTLLINGSVTSNVTLPTTALPSTTLGGSGGITGTLAVDAGRLAPGNSPGVLTVTGTVSLGTVTTPATLAVELGGNTPGNTAANYDQLLSTGVTAIANASLEATLVNSFVPSAADVFFIAARGDAAAHSAFFTGLPEGGTYTFTNGATAQITYAANWTGTQAGSSLTGGNDIALYNFSPVPEPGSVALLAAGLGLLAGRRRRQTSLR